MPRICKPIQGMAACSCEHLTSARSGRSSQWRLQHLCFSGVRKSHNACCDACIRAVTRDCHAGQAMPRHVTATKFCETQPCGKHDAAICLARAGGAVLWGRLSTPVARSARLDQRDTPTSAMAPALGHAASSHGCLCRDRQLAAEKQLHMAPTAAAAGLWSLTSNGSAGAAAHLTRPVVGTHLLN